VTTILGSCISVCLWDRRLGIGGINHFLMPDWTGRGRMSPRFGDVAIASLIESLRTLGCAVDDLTSKVFGGASVMGSPNSNTSLGAKNVRLARALLDEEGIPIVGEDTGGCAGRKLIYQTDDAGSWVKRL
jgi:chemotaxis protein CheD